MREREGVCVCVCVCGKKGSSFMKQTGRVRLMYSNRVSLTGKAKRKLLLKCEAKCFKLKLLSKV